MSQITVNTRTEEMDLPAIQCEACGTTHVVYLIEPWQYHQPTRAKYCPNCGEKEEEE